MERKVMEGYLALLLFLAVCYGQKPEQIHLSYGAEDDSMVVTWSTMQLTDKCVCQYGQSMDMTSKAYGYTTKFSVGHVQYIHRAKLRRLVPGARYLYQCGDGRVWSPVYSFQAKITQPGYQPKIAFYGDLGVQNERSVERLRLEVEKGFYDVVLHVGDLAYNMETNNSMVGDEFMNMIQPLAAQVPYMTCPGNHELYGNFTNYKNRFTMPTDEDSQKMFYSFNLGPVHIVSFSTEYYFFLQYGISQIWKQFEFLKKDLEEANRPENRKLRPWIITMGHKPMYCSNNDRDDCTNNESVIRTGIPFLRIFGLEDLFYDNGVDLTLWAHEHSYERLWPLYNRKIYNGSMDKPYTNPGAPVHIITGSAGCYSGHDPFKNNTQVSPWSALRSLDYGYSRMEIFNSTHLYMEQVSDDKGGEIVDKIWLIKDKHGPYEPRKKNQYSKKEFDFSDL